MSRIVVVTGANRGIGLAVCEQILNAHSPVNLYACSRSGSDLGLKHDPSSRVTYPKLDITNKEQIHALASQLKSEEGHVDVLVNNAGGNDPLSAEQILNVNYHGTLSMCQTFLPLLSKDGRIVNVSSVASGLQNYPKQVQARFRDSQMKIDDLDRLADEYLADKKPFNSTPAYSFSKACINGLTAVLARENPAATINACCPGWVATDMGKIMGQPPKSLADGAKIPVRLAVGHIDGVTGRYWANRGIGDTGDGQVQAW